MGARGSLARGTIRRVGRCLLALSLSAAVASTALPATAQEPALQYDALVDTALVEFDGGRYEEALAAFEQAFAIKPSARVLRGMAKALFELRSYARCVATSDAALTSDVDRLTGALRADLEALRQRALRFIGSAEVQVVPATATTLIDGRPLETFAARGAYVLDIGPHTLEAVAPDHHPTRRTFEVRGGETVRVAVKLQSARLSVDGSSSRGATTALAIGALALSISGVVASSVWLVDRNQALSRCEDSASAGARCANADSVAFQRDAAMFTVGISSVAVVLSTVLLVSVLRNGGDVPRSGTR